MSRRSPHRIALHGEPLTCSFSATVLAASSRFSFRRLQQPFCLWSLELSAYLASEARGAARPLPVAALMSGMRRKLRSDLRLVNPATSSHIDRIADNRFRKRPRLRDRALPLTAEGVRSVDLNRLLHRHRLSLMRLDQAASDDEKRAHGQFARDYAAQIKMFRKALGAEGVRSAETRRFPRPAVRSGIEPHRKS